MVDFGDIWEVFQVLARAAGSRDPRRGQRHRHAHVREADPRGPVGFEHMAEVHNALSEDLSFRRVIRLARTCRARALHDARERRHRRRGDRESARAQGLPVYGETLHQYLLYTPRTTSAERPDLSHLSVAEVEGGPGGAVGGHARRHHHTRRTDEVCCIPLNVKTIGKRIDDTTGGNAGVEPRVA
jgi:dihydropyrimidinase